jgi:hypothetical protein
MALLIAHTGAEPITYEDVVIQCRLDSDDDDTAERDLIERIVIPAARGLVEQLSGAAVRKGRYRDHLPSIPTGNVFAITQGQAFELESIVLGVAPGSPLLDTTACYLVNGGQESLLYTQQGRPWRELVGSCPQGMMVTYLAGIDIDEHPSVRHYLLLAAAWAYRHRELLVLGQTLNELPERYLLSLLAGITVPPRI